MSPPRPYGALTVRAKHCSARAYVSIDGKVVRLWMQGRSHAAPPIVGAAWAAVANWIAACAKADAEHGRPKRRRAA